MRSLRTVARSSSCKSTRSPDSRRKALSLLFRTVKSIRLPKRCVRSPASRPKSTTAADALPGAQTFLSVQFLLKPAAAAEIDASGLRMPVDTQIQPMSRLPEHARIPISFRVQSVFDVAENKDGHWRIELIERQIKEPW